MIKYVFVNRLYCTVLEWLAVDLLFNQLLFGRFHKAKSLAGFTTTIIILFLFQALFHGLRARCWKIAAAGRINRVFAQKLRIFIVFVAHLKVLKELIGA